MLIKNLISMLFLLMNLTGCPKPIVVPTPEPLVDPVLIQAVIEVESGGNPRAVSRSGAIGLMQIMPSTGRYLGYTRADLFDPEKNIEAGTKYLLEMGVKEDLGLALRRYNCGPKKPNRRVCYNYMNKILRTYNEKTLGQDDQKAKEETAKES